MNNIKTTLKKGWTLEARDWLKSLFYAVIVPVLLQVQSVLDSGSLSINWTLIAQVALSAAIAHLIRKLTERNKVVTVQKVGKDQADEAEAIVALANDAKVMPRLLSTDPPPLGDPTHPKKPKKPLQ